MIFAKLFGIRSDDADDPPTHPPVVRPAQPKPRPAPPGKPDAQGFDPYNSGVFKKSNAWERVNRR